jgi:hypothetical protein
MGLLVLLSALRETTRGVFGLVPLMLTVLELMLALLELELTLLLDSLLDAVLVLALLLLEVLLFFAVGGVVGMEFALFGDFPSLTSVLLLLLLLLASPLSDGALIAGPFLHSLLSLLRLLSDAVEEVEELVALPLLLLASLGLLKRGAGSCCKE